MLGWVKTIGIMTEQVYRFAIALHDLFLYHLYPIGVFCKNVLFGHIDKFPVELTALATAFAICFIVRFLWNAGRGAGA